jgi:phosphonate transport system permease protein
LTAATLDLPRLGWTNRRRIAAGVLAALVWSVSRAGVGDEIVNPDGWSSFARFWTAVADPELSSEFLRLTIDAAIVTLSFAVLGTTLSLVIGAVGALFLSELVTGRGLVWRVARAVMVVPRAVHEIIWALLLIQIFGFDPLVAVMAIGVPFGAVTARVFAETIDEADPAPYRALRASGAPRLSALCYGVAPNIRGELISYSFYRFECAIRSAAVLGVIGAGGVGFQLGLSFESLRYHEIWTLIAALMILSGITDWWSSSVRRSARPGVGAVSLVGVAVLIPVSWRWAGLDLSTLWSSRTRSLAVDLVGDLLPFRLGPGGWSELIDASVDTVAMSVLALAIAGIGGLALGAASARPTQRTARPTLLGLTARGAVRTVLLLFRAVPAPVWAFLAVLILFPGMWPGAVALGVYNLGVLGRLFAETIEDRDTHPADALTLSGATRTQNLFYATLPAAGPRLVSLALYRWEVIVRETVVVGVVGAGGLGQLINEHLAARDFAAVAGAMAALVVVAAAIDAISAAVRRQLR